MRSKADETLVIVETLICPLQMVKLNLNHSHVAIIAIGFSEKGIKSASGKLSKASQNAILKICQPVYNF